MFLTYVQYYFLLGIAVMSIPFVINAILLFRNYQKYHKPLKPYAWLLLEAPEIEEGFESGTSINLVFGIIVILLWPLFLAMQLHEYVKMYSPPKNTPLLQRIADYYHRKHHPEHYI